LPIRRHGAGWEVRLQHGGRRYSKTVTTRSDAQYLEAKLRQRVSDTRAGRVPSHSLEEALARWLREEFPRLKSQQSYKSLIKVTLPHLSGRALHSVVEVASAIRQAGLDGGLGPAPINRRLALLKRIAKLAYKRWHWLENDLGARIELLPGEVRRTEWVTLTEAKRLLAASDPDIREAIRWALLTGLRRGELLSIQPHHFRDRVIYLQADLTKSGKARAIPVPAELDPKHFPFGLKPTYLANRFLEARRRAGLPHIRFHDLRRSFGTWLVQKRTDAAVVRDLLGHSTLTMTSRYLGTDLTQLKKAMKSLPSLGLSRGSRNASHSRKRA
jgi:integrase